LVEVRGQRWVVSEPPSPGYDGETTLLTLQSVEDGRYGESLQVIWEVEPGRRVLPAGSLPEVTPDGFDPPERLAAFLDAVRWSAVTSADTKTLQAPLRSGATWSAGSRRTSSTGCSCRRPRTTATPSRSPHCLRSSTT